MKTVGRKGSKYGQATLSEPGESPDTFDGRPLRDAVSPSGSRATVKFFTSKGSEYALAPSGESRRIKSGQGSGDEGLHGWSTLTLFSGRDWTCTNFDTCVRTAFRNGIPVAASFRNGSLSLYALLDGKWTALRSPLQLTKPDAECPRDVVTVRNVSRTPETGLYVADFRIDGKRILYGYHPGHDVSYVERSGKRTDVAAAEAECMRVAGNEDAAVEFAVDGRSVRGVRGGVTVGGLFDMLRRKHGLEGDFVGAFRFRGAVMSSFVGARRAGNGVVLEFRS